MGNVFDLESPELVVFTGDYNDGGATEGVTNSVSKFLEPTLSRDLPFATVSGNHDKEAGLTRSELMDQYLGKPGFGGEVGPNSIHGYGNYVLSINSKSKPAFSLWFFDSGDYSKFDSIDGYNWVWGDQIQWYVRKSKQREEEFCATLPAFAFFHIPLPEYDTMLSQVGISGEQNEGVCAGAIHSGLFETLVERTEVKAATVGHDHCNDYCGNYYGIDLYYGGGTGYDGYGCADTDKWARRSRVISIRDFGQTIRSWKILDDGKLTKIDEETLWSVDGAKLNRRNRAPMKKIVKERKED